MTAERKAIELAEKLKQRHINEEKYYGDPINPLIQEAAEELLRLQKAFSGVCDAWARAEQKISTLIKEKSDLERKLSNACSVIDYKKERLDELSG